MTTFPYTFFIGSKSWDLLSSEPPRGDSSATESRFFTSWVIASPLRKKEAAAEKWVRVEVEFLISAVRWHLPLGLVTKGTRGRVQILLTVKSLTLALGIQLETILSQGPGNQTTRAGLPSSVNL